MKTLATLVLLTGFAPLAFAHPEDGTLAEQLAHQFTSTHHLPILLLAAIVAVALIVRRSRRRR